MDEKDNSRSSLQTAADLGRAAKAAYRIAQAAAVSGVHGAAAAAVKETVPALVKFLLVVLLIMIVIPMVVFTALPNIFFGYDSSDTASVIHMTEQAMRIGGAYMSLDDFERTQIDSIVTGIAAEYEADGTAIDHADSFRIGNATLPQSRVRAKLRRLDGLILREAESKLRANQERNVKNSTAYTMAVLFNCIAESESDLMIDPYLNTICAAV